MKPDLSKKPTDLDTLKAWCHWVLKNPTSEDQADLAKAVNDVISQVGTWKAKFEQQTERVTAAEVDRDKWKAQAELAWKQHDAHYALHKGNADHAIENARLRERLDKMHGLVDLAAVEAKYFGPRTDSNDGRTLKRILDGIVAKADAIARDSESRQETLQTSGSSEAGKPTDQDGAESAGERVQMDAGDSASGRVPRAQAVEVAGSTPAPRTLSTTQTETAKPEYYYKGGMTTYKAGVDPEVTCPHCKKTFLCDAMDAACRLCDEWFSDARIKQYGSRRSPKETKDG